MQEGKVDWQLGGVAAFVFVHHAGMAHKQSPRHTISSCQQVSDTQNEAAVIVRMSCRHNLSPVARLGRQWTSRGTALGSAAWLSLPHEQTDTLRQGQNEHRDIAQQWVCVVSTAVNTAHRASILHGVCSVLTLR